MWREWMKFCDKIRVVLNYNKKNSAWDYSCLVDELFADYDQRLRSSVFLRYPPFSVARFGYSPDALKKYIVAVRHLRLSLHSGSRTTLCSQEVGPPLLTSVPWSKLHSRLERMYTICSCLADTGSPYFAMGLGNYYATTPETFAFDI